MAYDPGLGYINFFFQFAVTDINEQILNKVYIDESNSSIRLIKNVLF